MTRVDLPCCACSTDPLLTEDKNPLRLALVGTPNCGKTALFNALTGSRQKVANYAGVTVERKEGRICMPSQTVLHLIDLPGTMSLRARSPDEEITRDVILGKRPDEAIIDALLCVADATNLKPTLRLVLELKKVGLPILLVINMMDIAKAHGYEIDLSQLSQALDIPVIGCTAVRPHGIDDLLGALCQHTPLWRDARKLVKQNVWRDPEAALLRAWSNESDNILIRVLKAPQSPSTTSNAIDKVVLHPFFGLILLFGVLFLMFQALFAIAAPLMDFIDASFGYLAGYIQTNMADTLARHFITDALISGVGSVLVFLPQVVLLFVFIIFLEDFGYMARAAFLMDRLMGGVGLHGRAFIPLLSSFACAIPGIMATRTIANPKDRLTTILIAPFMTCSARLPVYTLIISALIPDQKVGGIFGLQGLVMFALYAMGILGGLVVAFILKRGVFKGETEPLLLSLPNYTMPNWKNVAMGVWLRAWTFIQRAGTIIFFITIVVWLLSAFPLPQAGATAVIDESYAGLLGRWLAPFMAPIGFSWQMTLSLIPAMAAREVAVATLGTIYAVGGASSEAHPTLAVALQEHWPLASALSYLTWFVFAPQCLSTLVVVKQETNKWRWPLIMFVYMSLIAYAASFAVYQTALAFQ